MRADLVLAVVLAAAAAVGSRGAAEVSHPAVPLDAAGYALVVTAALAFAYTLWRLPRESRTP